MRSQRRDVGLDTSLERRDVRSQRRNVGFEPLWNAATFELNVATLVLHFSETSRRWFCTSLERRDVGLQRRDVELDLLWNVATLHSNIAMLPCLRPKTPSFLLFPCLLFA